MTKAKDETPEQRENRLVKARKQAGKTREQAMKEKDREKILEDLRKEEESENDSEAPVPVPAPVVPVVPVVPQCEVPVVPQCAAVKKPRKKPAAKIIVEQDSDDSDFFEDKPNIIFVKRITKKKPEPPQPAQPAQPAQPVPQPTPVIAPYIPRTQPYDTVPPPKPQPTPQQKLLIERYNNMARGNFLPISRPR